MVVVAVVVGALEKGNERDFIKVKAPDTIRRWSQ